MDDEEYDVGEEVHNLNVWFVINTIFTILAGVASVVIAVIALVRA